MPKLSATLNLNASFSSCAELPIASFVMCPLSSNHIGQLENAIDYWTNHAKHDLDAADTTLDTSKWRGTFDGRPNRTKCFNIHGQIRESDRSNCFQFAVIITDIESEFPK